MKLVFANNRKMCQPVSCFQQEQSFSVCVYTSLIVHSPLQSLKTSENANSFID